MEIYREHSALEKRVYGYIKKERESRTVIEENEK